MVLKRLLFFSCLLWAATPAHAKLRIVATTPDLADIARRVGGDLVNVETLAKGTEDIHSVPQRPSFVPKLAQAQGIVHLGLWAEHAFLPALIEAAANPALQPGQNGDIDCSVHIKPLNVPVSLSRAEGELHPDGNPHYNTDPRNGTAIARAIAEAFARLDTTNKAVYEKNRAAFEQELAGKLKEWEKRTASLVGLRAISYHRDMVYFADYLKIVLIGEIEPKPGIAPSPRHLAELAEKIKKENAKLLLFEIQYSESAPHWLADQTGIRVAKVATMGGAFSDSATYMGMIEHNINSVLEALK